MVGKPLGLHWRSSVWFVTFVVGLGITTDLLAYSIVVPVMPFELERLGYHGVSALVGWLLFAYSGGLVLATPPLAYFSELYNDRKIPLLGGQLALIVFKTILPFPSMLTNSLLDFLLDSCDTAPEIIVGRQLGIAMAGLAIGFLVGPPVAGALYEVFGIRGPFIFGIIVTAMDLVGRLLVVERKDALQWGVDPAAQYTKVASAEAELAEKTVVPPPTSADHTPEKASTDPDPSDSQVQQELRNDPIAVHEVITAKPRASFQAVIITMLRSPRALAVFMCTLINGVVITTVEPTLPLHLQRVWNFNASKVGLIYIAAVVPTIFSSPLSGWWTDRKGAAEITLVLLACAFPWAVLLIVQRSLPFFIVAFALEGFFVSGLVSPLTAELAAITRQLDGVGYAHVYGVFNLTYGIGSAIGPIIGGQLYDRLKHGWTIICLFDAGLILVFTVLAFVYFGDDPILARLRKGPLPPLAA
ncbi:putative MFS-type transporter C18.02 [Grifola frondosa]|uniref:Putative MFS-type transporter C18.02 n=1 Tax=Grifola frondosa TaxID=5627 RepID=A0A1C7MQF0_GRIFR|nr:putative MFS-type transporter C18.02 [Grifola frondosa]